MADKQVQQIRHSRYAGYDEYTTQDGQPFFVDKATGEVLQSERVRLDVDVVEGSDINIVTPAQKEKQERQRQGLQEKFNQKIEKMERGSFIWVTRGSVFQDLKPEELARLLRLACFLDYDGTLRRKTKEAIKRADLPAILNLSPAHADNTIKALQEYLTVNDAGEYMLTTPYIIRGAIPQGGHTDFTRLYTSRYKGMYAGVPAGSHSRIGFIFKFLPYLNVKWNLLSFSPDEADLNAAEPISLKYFCERIGFDYTRAYRLKKEYGKMQVTGTAGKKEPALYIAGRGADSAIFVNPELVYSGSALMSAKEARQEYIAKFYGNGAGTN